jgi:hypothetical protein
LNKPDSGLYGDKSDPYVLMRVGREEKRTSTIKGSLNPVWSADNDFVFDLTEENASLDLLVWNANYFKDDCLGGVAVALQVAPGLWHHRRERLRDGGIAEIEYDLFVEPLGGVQQPTSPSLSEKGRRVRVLSDNHRPLSMESNCGAAAALGLGGSFSNNVFGKPDLFGKLPSLMGGLAAGGNSPQQLGGCGGFGQPLSPKGTGIVGRSIAASPGTVYAAPTTMATTYAAPTTMPTTYAAPTTTVYDAPTTYAAAPIVSNIGTTYASNGTAGIASYGTSSYAPGATTYTGASLGTTYASPGATTYAAPTSTVATTYAGAGLGTTYSTGGATTYTGTGGGIGTGSLGTTYAGTSYATAGQYGAIGTTYSAPGTTSAFPTSGITTQTLPYLGASTNQYIVHEY